MRVFLVIFIALQIGLEFGFAQPQVLQRDTSVFFTSSNQERFVLMGGSLDAVNTFTHPSSIAFQPMNSVRISNDGTTTVRRPRVVVNSKRNWFDIDGVRAEAFDGAVTPKEKALALWKFVRDNRLHYNEPDYGLESDDPMKLLGVYGYGICYNISYATAFIAAITPVSGQPYREYAPRDKHSVKDIKFDSIYMLIDPDIEVFYLSRDNERLATYDELLYDKDLIRRTHHYGKSYSFNFRNAYVADGVYEPTPARYTGYVTRFHSLDFSLRPGESIEYDWAPAQYYHHRVPWSSHSAPAEDVGNGKFIYATNFVNADLSELLTGYENVMTSEADESIPRIHPVSAGDTAAFVIKVTSPFVMVNAEVQGKFYRNSEDDQLAVLFSKDSINWELVGESASLDRHSNTFSITDNIEPLEAEATYHYYLKFVMLSAASESDCGIDSLRIITDFQVNRFFLPSLSLGENHVSYSDANTDERLVSVHFNWREAHNEMPPPPVAQPIFPANDAVVDNLKFTFKWSPSPAADIADYEFLLSDREDMKFPLSPTFEVYTSVVNHDGGLAEFEVPFDGLLNSGKKYYWKVRAKNSKGVWGDWSDVWSFTPQGPMPPTLNEPSVSPDSIVLNWEKHSDGVIPAHYEIHASNEDFGFTPDESTLIATTAATSFAFPTAGSTPKTFYRVIAVSGNGARSGTSNVASIPYPYIYQQPPAATPNEPYAFELKSNEVYSTEGFEVLTSFAFLNVPDQVNITFLSGPAWLSFDAASHTLYGDPKYQELLGDTASVKIELSSTFTDKKTVQKFRIPIDLGTHSLTSENRVFITPNPFSSETHIVYDAPEGSFLEIVVLDSRGQKVFEAMSTQSYQGIQTFVWRGGDQPSGLYFVRIREVGENGQTSQITRKVIKL